MGACLPVAPSAKVRQAAALCVCALLAAHAERDGGGALEAGGGGGILLRGGILTLEGKQQFARAEAALDRCIAIGVADAEPHVRRAVLSALAPSLDAYLAQPQPLNLLALALRDVHADVRHAAVAIVARLRPRNPAVVQPALRALLRDLLAELRYAAPPGRREGAATLLTALVCAAPSLIQPYGGEIMGALRPLLLDADAPVAASALGTLGELAEVAGEAVRPAIPSLLPLLLPLLQDSGSAQKRHAALRALSQLLRSAGCAADGWSGGAEITLLHAHDCIDREDSPRRAARPRRIRRRRIGRRRLAIGSDARASTSIRTTAATTRRPPATTTAVSTAATLTKGARCSRAEAARKGRRAPPPTFIRARPSCSPHCSRCYVPSKRPPRASSSSVPSGCSARPIRGSSPMQPPSRRRSRRRRPLPKRRRAVAGAGGRGGSGGGSGGGGGGGARRRSRDDAPLRPSDVHFYPSMALEALTRIVRDASLASHHAAVLGALVQIMASLGSRCVRFLPALMPRSSSPHARPSRRSVS